MKTRKYLIFDNRVGNELIPLTEEQLRAIDDLNRVIGDRVLVSERADAGMWQLHAGSYVGTVRVRDLTVQIVPKIHQSGTEGIQEQAISATKNLLYMLKYSENLEVREQGLAPLLSRKGDWFEIVTYLFAFHLYAEIQRGYVKDYIPYEDEIPRLKGKWLVDKQLRFPAQNHKLWVVFDEFTEDNNLNRIFRYVVERLWQLTSDINNKRLLDDLRQIMGGVTLLRTVTNEDAHKTTVSRLHQQYEPILNLARLFLDNSTLQVATGKLNTFAFVFDMNKLFESFVVGFIQRHRKEILPDSLRSCVLRSQSKGTSLFLARKGEGCVFKVEPDLVFSNGSEYHPLILDAKYKVLDTRQRDLGVEQGDFYQMFAYVHRYPGCETAILLYPWVTHMGKKPERTIFHLLDDTDKKRKVCVATLSMDVDLSDKEDRNRLKKEISSILEAQDD